MIIGLALSLVIGSALYTRRYLRSVVDFMAGGRCAGRYMLCAARGEMASGAVVFVSLFEVYSHAGFTLTWWQWLSFPVIAIVAASGFVVYRYRETRALTLAQFLEMRYSKSLRIFSGLLSFLAGIMNFGIIPAVGARFFVYFIGFPPELSLLGFTVSTFVLVMISLMSVTILLTLSGGQISVMVSDCISGLMDQWLFLVITIVLICMFSWTQVTEVMLVQPEPGKSLMNPFDALGLDNFNVWYVLMEMSLLIYGTMAWQNASAYNSAALTPHESRMGNVLGRWREFGRILAITVLAVAGITYMNHPDFLSDALSVRDVLASLENERLQGQMTIPTALSYLLPVGIKGLLCAVLITGVWGGDTTHLHSWGGILVQDVIMPLRRKPFTTKGHILALRLSMLGVGLFAVLFGAFFTQTEYITMWFKITTAIFVGGAGSVIIGGLYWKKGTIQGAWTAMLTGSILSIAGILIRQVYADFPLNPVQISSGASLIAISLYVVVSLLTCRKDFDLDQMLHREPKTRKQKLFIAEKHNSQPVWRRLFANFTGANKDYSTADWWIASLIIGWLFCLAGIMVLGTVWNLIDPWKPATWSTFWLWMGILIPLVISAATAVWFTYGVVRDLRVFFRVLRTEKVDADDDGSVQHD
ncbi:sodium:solute symporter family protein [Cerasicoccus arenae]